MPDLKSFPTTSSALVCSHCGNETIMYVLCQGKYDEWVKCQGFEYPFYKEYKVLICATCRKESVYKEFYEPPDEEFPYDGIHEREFIYPSKKRVFRHLPGAVSHSYNIASRLSKIEPLASAVFTGRTIECICKDVLGNQNLPSNLSKMIKTLVDQNKIPDMLGDMANQIRIIRNDVIHDPEGDVEAEDALLLLEFCEVILEYVYEFKPMLQELQKKRQPV